MTHLQRLEAESIHIMREAVAESERPVMLYSIGKDSSVMLHLALKAFYPSKPPFPLLHVDTTWKFRAMYEFRDEHGGRGSAWSCSCTRTPSACALGINPFDHGSAVHTDMWKTEGLKQALDHYGFDLCVRRRPSRRGEVAGQGADLLDPLGAAPLGPEAAAARAVAALQRPPHQRARRMRVFPLSNWTELDVWQYIHLEQIPIVPLYLAAPRPVVERDGTLIMVDDDRMPLRARRGARAAQRPVPHARLLPAHRARSRARPTTLTEIIQEMLLATTSERQGRVIDHDSSGSMEKKKQEGYF